MRATIYFFLLLFFTQLEFGFAQCADTSNIYTFSYNGTNYELVRENKNWSDAAACAVARGGQLAIIDDSLEQIAIYTEISTNAAITASNTVAPDGGGASYIWLGGNDFAVEGNWVWDGNGDSLGVQFWQGTRTGNAVGNQYNNWGNEPDDFGTLGQDGLGLAITNWPLGVASQWNDIRATNTIYYLIEYAPILPIFSTPSSSSSVRAYPNPTNGQITLQDLPSDLDAIQVYNVLGERVLQTTTINNEELSLEHLEAGIYFLNIRFNDHSHQIIKIHKK
jgi:hypothetical protein